MSRVPRFVESLFQHRLLADDEDHGDHSEFGVHITYENLYDTVVFLTAIYCAGVLASRFLKMPNLVGEIVAGIIMGPPLIDCVPNPEAFVLLGEIGLVLLVVEAGIDIDVSTLKLIGTRGFIIALVGSILPIAMGIVIAIVIYGTGDMKAAIAAGCTFGPTSLGIALNILRSGGILNTPVGQLIVSAAVIDDMIALIVLSQLESLTGTIDAAGVLVPVISALAYLVIGGYIALYILPGILSKHVLSRVEHEYHGKVEMAIMFGILLFMMPATHYAKASYLMGAFVAGLGFCTSHTLHETFVRQFKRVLQWLMRIFFAASIGFQVPIKEFNEATVIWQGLVFTIALLGKIFVGFLVPNFTQSKSFTGMHLRDCLIVGFSMAAEGEFAFVIAVFSIDSELIDKTTYASVVLAVLLSTIIPPFLLRFTISYYNKKAEEDIKRIANEELNKNHSLEFDSATVDSANNNKLASEIRNQRAVFLCIQTQCELKWGLMHSILAVLSKLGLDVIDHRSWHPRGINTTLVNEIYAKDVIKLDAENKGMSHEILDQRMKEINDALQNVIKQPDTSRIRVQRWYPGVVEEIIESVHEKCETRGQKNLNVEQRLLLEASRELERKQNVQLNATKQKSVKEILDGMQADPGIVHPAGADSGAQSTRLPVLNEGVTAEIPDAAPKKARRRRQKMRSTPVVGGGLFGETSSSGESKEEEEDESPAISRIPSAKKIGPGAGGWKPTFDFRPQGYKAEIIVDGESYSVRINDATLKRLRTGFSGDLIDNRGFAVSGGVEIEADGSNVVSRLQGFVRNAGTLNKIMEEHNDGESVVSSLQEKKEDDEGTTDDNLPV